MTVTSISLRSAAALCLGLAVTNTPTAPAWAAETANCASLTEVADFAENWRRRQPSKALAADGDLADALCTQAKLVDRLRETLGEPIGYIVGLSNAESQKAFKTDRPIRGVALEGMILDDGALVRERFGYWPFFEADLLVEIEDGGVNQATTPAEVLEHIRAIRPFIGLIDIGVTPDQPVTPVTLTAQNAAAWRGVLGRSIPAEPTPRFLNALGEMTVTLTGGDGSELGRAQGKSILGHPLNSVLWLIDQGVTLKRGDLVNVGAIGPIVQPTAANGRAVATYRGLPGDPSVTVRFK